VIFQFVTAVSKNITVFLDAALCSLIEIDRRFRGAYYPDDGLPMKSRPTFTTLHDETSQKTVIFNKRINYSKLT
jgi:hypothetical protein